MRISGDNQDNSQTAVGKNGILYMECSEQVCVKFCFIIGIESLRVKVRRGTHVVIDAAFGVFLMVRTRSLSSNNEWLF